MERPSWTKRNTRTTLAQLTAFITYLEENPVFTQSNPFKKENRFNASKWNELAGILNSIKGPSKKAKEWRLSLVHWKNQLKSRTRQIRADKTATANSFFNQKITLTSLEARALTLFGELKIENKDFEESSYQSSEPISSNPIEEFPSVSRSFKMEPEIDLGETQFSELVGLSDQRRNRSCSIESAETEKNSIRMQNDRDEFDRRVIEQRMEIERQNCEAVNKIADAVSKMADALLIFAEAYAKK